MFEGVNDAPFARAVNGKVRYSVSASEPVSSVNEFQLARYGDAIAGVMTRYLLALSGWAITVLKKYHDVFFSGRYLALDFGR